MISAKKKFGKWVSVIRIAVVLLAVFFLVFFLYIRELVLNVDQHRDSIETFIIDRIGARFHLGPLSVSWTGLSPVIEVDNISIGDVKAPALIFTQWNADIDLVKSMWHKSLIWREFSINNIDVSFEEDEKGFWKLKGLSKGGGDNLKMIIEPIVYSK